MSNLQGRRSKNHKRAKARNTNRKKNSNMNLTYGPGQVRTIQAVPNSMQVVLKYVDPTFIYGNYSNFDWSTRFRLNSVYDPDPHITTGGTISYFNEYAALFTRYRVISVKYKVIGTNNMTEPVIFTVAPSKEDLGDNYAKIQQLAEINHGTTQMLGSAGSMNRAIVRGNLNMATFSGYPGYLTDDTTAARVNADPSVLWYLNVGFTSNLQQSAVSFGVRTELFYTVVFYQPKTDAPVSITSVKANTDRPSHDAYVLDRRPVPPLCQTRQIPPMIRSISEDRQRRPVDVVLPPRREDVPTL